MAREYRLVSADSHLDLNPDVWTHRVPAKYRDRAPKVVRQENGSDAIVCDGGEAHTIGITRNVGVPFEELPFVIPKFSVAGRQRHTRAPRAGAGSRRRRCRDHVYLGGAHVPEYQG